MNMQEAADHAEGIIDATLKAIDPSVEVMRGPSSDSNCTDFKSAGTGTGSVTRRRYVMTIISDERRGGFLGVVERYWKKHGYKITSVRNSTDMPAIFAVDPDCGEAVENTRQRDGYVVIDRVARGFVLRRGSELTRIYNDGLQVEEASALKQREKDPWWRR